MEHCSSDSGETCLEYFVLDVFTKIRLQGNPLAVVLNPGTLTTETMQSIAREMNLSETTFVERRDADVELREGIRTRIFTTQEELPFAGHPTLGTASLLRTIAPGSMAGDTISLAVKVGKVPVRFADIVPGAPQWPMQAEMTQRDPEFGAILDPLQVALLTGLAVEDFDPARPIQIVSTGTAFAIVSLRSVVALARLRVRHEDATAFLRAVGARWFYVIAPTAASSPGEPAWRARMQFHGGEDPATGSAAGCAIGYLVRHCAVEPDSLVHLRQGVEIGRPSDLYLRAGLQNHPENSIQTGREARVTKVRVGGSTILVAKGRLFLP